MLQTGGQREQVPQGPCFVNHHSPCAELPGDPLIPMLVSSGEAAGHGQVSRGQLGPSSERPSQPGRCRSHLTHLQSLWGSSNGRMQSKCFPAAWSEHPDKDEEHSQWFPQPCPGHTRTISTAASAWYLLTDAHPRGLLPPSAPAPLSGPAFSLFDFPPWFPLLCQLERTQ